jgi:hypothetical protein
LISAPRCKKKALPETFFRQGFFVSSKPTIYMESL